MLNSIKKIYKTIQFKKNSIYEKGTIFDSSSACINQTNNPKNIKIGQNCLIRGVLKVVGEGKITIGDNTYIGGGTVIGAVENIRIESNVIISTDVHIYDNNNHPTEPKKREDMTKSLNYFGEKWKWTESKHKPIVIEENVWIGERATILKGVTIEKGSIVACNSVVTKNVPKYSLVAGNPAKVVKKIEEITDAKE